MVAVTRCVDEEATMAERMLAKTTEGKIKGGDTTKIKEDVGEKRMNSLGGKEVQRCAVYIIANVNQCLCITVLVDTCLFTARLP